ncbi:hypothetical protein ACTQ3M_09695, partial [Oscillospiraceae bacterium LCP25S3_E10]
MKAFGCTLPILSPEYSVHSAVLPVQKKAPASFSLAPLRCRILFFVQCQACFLPLSAAFQRLTFALYIGFELRNIFSARCKMKLNILKKMRSIADHCVRIKLPHKIHTGRGNR